MSRYKEADLLPRAESKRAGDRFRAARLGRGWTLKAAEAESGVSATAIRFGELGICQMTRVTAGKIAAALGMGLDEATREAR